MRTLWHFIAVAFVSVAVVTAKSARGDAEISPAVASSACDYSIKNRLLPWTCYLKGVNRKSALAINRISALQLEAQCKSAAGNPDLVRGLPNIRIAALPPACAKVVQSTLNMMAYKATDIW